MLGLFPAAFTVARRASAADAHAKSSPPTITETVLHSFCSQRDPGNGVCLDGYGPGGGILGSGGVIEGSDGNFYGTTVPFFSGGTIFKLTPSGTLTTLHSFCPSMDPNLGGCLDGAGPVEVIEGSDRNFYGIATEGGANLEPGGGSAGTAYMITPSGTLTTLYSFCALLDPKTEECLDGESPDRIIEGSDGNFYGTTFMGGAKASGGAQPGGTVFKMTPSGTLTTLYSFCTEVDPSTINCLDGEQPAALIEGNDGNFYGITFAGGQFARVGIGGGTVFKITRAGTLTTLHSFCSDQDPNTGNCFDGNEPVGLIEGTDGNFYVSTTGGGAYDDGAVIRLTPSGTLTTLYSFCSQGNRTIHQCLDGTSPYGVTEGSDGNFYGTTRAGGKFGNQTSDGTAFMLTPSGKLTTLYSFCSEVDPNTLGCLDGALPNGGVIEGSDGNFYGTSENGGANGDPGFGTVFKLAVSFPTQVPANLTISPGAHSFGKTKIGTTRQGTFLVRSRTKNTVPIVLENFTISGADYSVDSTLTTCGQAQMLQPNQTCKIVVDFMPLGATNQLSDTGRLTVTSNAEQVHPNHGLVTLRGGGKP
jgi:uncharacterized repeat protein (TIGR03803 family)